MATKAELFGAQKAESCMLVLFIPSVDRDHQPIDQLNWREAALQVLGRLFGGATAFPQGRGVWRDDTQDGKLIFDEPIMIQCYTGEQLIEANYAELKAFLVRLGTETRQGAVGFVIDREYLEIRFPRTV